MCKQAIKSHAAWALRLASCLVFALATELQPVRAAAPTLVYECSLGEQRVFSDRPCDATAKQRQIDEPNRMNAQDTRILRRRDAAPARREQSNTAAIERRRAVCKKNREQTVQLQALMRRGYTAAQGMRYDERLRKLRDQYREQRCASF